LINAFLDSGVKADDPQIRMLANDLAASTISSASGNHWESFGDSSKTSWMTSVSTTALVALAFARAQPDHQLLAQSVRWLVVARGAQGWHTTIDRAFAILALSTYATKTGELGGDYAYRVSLDDREVLAGLVKPGADPVEGATRIPLSQVTPGKTSLLALDRSGAKGRLYYTLDLRYQTPAKDIEALNRGFAVSHVYSLLDAPDKTITSAKLGDTVRVTITVIASADRNYVTVEDLLPAGLEPVDPRLKTTDPALVEQLERERVAAYEKGTGTVVAPWYRWYYSPWQQVDLRDDRAVLRTDVLRRGVYEYVYYARATTTGSFFVAPALAGESYFPEVFGRSDSGRFTVTAP
jgi:alpha-2-macroglobulin